MMKPWNMTVRNLKQLFAPARDEAEALCRAWRRDPLSHPALRNMTLTELADLPFDRTPCAERPDAD